MRARWWIRFVLSMAALGVVLLCRAAYKDEPGYDHGLQAGIMMALAIALSPRH